MEETMLGTAQKIADTQSYTGPDGTGWVCDVCEEQIKTAGDGWVQSISVTDGAGNAKERDLSLVHHLPASPLMERRPHGCQFDEQMEFHKDGGIVGDLSLADYNTQMG